MASRIARDAACLALLGALHAALSPTSEARAEPDSAAGDEALTLAKDLNRQGIAMLEAGDYERALDYFRRSRAALPSSKNVANIAICLDKLGRYDEALEQYEELLTRFSSGLDSDDRAAIAPAMATLRSKVGSVAISSNVGGAVVIDGRARGSLPLAAPVRLLGGTHRVRVLKDGYETFESKIDVAAGATVAVDAVLKPLLGVGQLRVEATGPSVPVYIDKSRVGTTPWEGVVSSGKHLVWAHGDGVGTGPALVVVLERQTALVRLEPRELGPETTLRADPQTAVIEVDGTAVGAGAWTGILPRGEHAVTAYEPGYFLARARVSPGELGQPGAVTLRLVVDRDHPRWPRPPTGNVWMQAFVGYAAATTVSAGAEAACPAACRGSNPPASGVSAGARVGYRFPFRLSLELGLGYLTLSSSFSRTASSSFGPADGYHVTYDLHDALVLRGPFGAAGTSYRMPFGGGWSATARLAAGVWLVTSTDPVDGTAETRGPPSLVVLGDRNTALFSPAFFVAPALAASREIGPLEIGLALELVGVLTRGPPFAHSSFQAEPNPDRSEPGAVGNARASTAIANERAYGPFIVWTPELYIQHTF